MKAVILAGGKGKRMRPFTHVVPKPLLPFKERPILEHIILYLKNYGIVDFIISIGHLGYQIKNYFGDGSEFGVNIEYAEEKKPLGTAGCLNLIKDKIKDTFLLFGGDNLTTLNLKKFIQFHKKKNGIATIALFEFAERSEYGIYELNPDHSINKFLEKPVFTHNAGTMIFCLEPEIFDFIPANKEEKVINITDHIIPALLKAGKKIFGYKFKGYWIDIGRMHEYMKMNNSTNFN
jgi:NDP-sugar pyrophosphorylase family protein